MNLTNEASSKITQGHRWVRSAISIRSETHTAQFESMANCRPADPRSKHRCGTRRQWRFGQLSRLWMRWRAAIYRSMLPAGTGEEVVGLHKAAHNSCMASTWRHTGMGSIHRRCWPERFGFIALVMYWAVHMSLTVLLLGWVFSIYFSNFNRMRWTWQIYTQIDSLLLSIRSKLCRNTEWSPEVWTLKKRIPVWFFKSPSIPLLIIKHYMSAMKPSMSPRCYTWIYPTKVIPYMRRPLSEDATLYENLSSSFIRPPARQVTPS
jgi:hypothetical protein